MSRMRGHQYVSSLHMLTESSDVHTYILHTYFIVSSLKGLFRNNHYIYLIAILSLLLVTILYLAKKRLQNYLKGGLNSQKPRSADLAQSLELGFTLVTYRRPMCGKHFFAWTTDSKAYGLVNCRPTLFHSSLQGGSNLSIYLQLIKDPNAIKYYKSPS